MHLKRFISIDILEAIPVTWSSGTYGLMRPESGCPTPGSTWELGTLLQDNENDQNKNNFSVGIDLYMGGTCNLPSSLNSQICTIHTPMYIAIHIVFTISVIIIESKLERVLISFCFQPNPPVFYCVYVEYYIYKINMFIPNPNYHYYINRHH